MTLFAYVWLRDKDRTKGGVHTPTALVVIYSVAGVLALVSCLVWLAAAGDELLPFPLSNLDRSSPLAPWVVVLTILICAAALSVLWAFRRSVLDQWLMVVVLASMVETGDNSPVRRARTALHSRVLYRPRIFCSSPQQSF